MCVCTAVKVVEKTAEERCWNITTCVGKSEKIKVLLSCVMVFLSTAYRWLASTGTLLVLYWFWLHRWSVLAQLWFQIPFVTDCVWFYKNLSWPRCNLCFQITRANCREDGTGSTSSRSINAFHLRCTTVLLANALQPHASGTLNTSCWQLCWKSLSSLTVNTANLRVPPTNLSTVFLLFSLGTFLILQHVSKTSHLQIFRMYQIYSTFAFIRSELLLLFFLFF